MATSFILNQLCMINHESVYSFIQQLLPRLTEYLSTNCVTQRKRSNEKARSQIGRFIQITLQSIKAKYFQQIPMIDIIEIFPTQTGKFILPDASRQFTLRKDEKIFLGCSGTNFKENQSSTLKTGSCSNSKAVSTSVIIWSSWTP